MPTNAAISYSEVTRNRKDDMRSKEVPFRHFNNYIKKMLIQFALDTCRQNANHTAGVSVLDLGSGRGGDIGKWLYSQSPALGVSTAKLPRSEVVRTSYYEGYDISSECIAEAQRRYDSFDMPEKCPATFSVADCFTEQFLRLDLRKSPHFGMFDIVSVQFAFHYACRSRKSIRSVMEGIAAALKKGGVVIITTVDYRELSKRVCCQQMSNSLYSLSLTDTPKWESGPGGEQLLTLGTEYHFQLDGFVNCSEFVVPLPFVYDDAIECGLRECSNMSGPFERFLPSYESNWKLSKGNKLSGDERELVTLYRTLCFEKQ